MMARATVNEAVLEAFVVTIGARQSCLSNRRCNSLSGCSIKFYVGPFRSRRHSRLSNEEEEKEDKEEEEEEEEEEEGGEGRGEVGKIRPLKDTWPRFNGSSETTTTTTTTTATTILIISNSSSSDSSSSSGGSGGSNGLLQQHALLNNRPDSSKSSVLLSAGVGRMDGTREKAPETKGGGRFAPARAGAAMKSDCGGECVGREDLSVETIELLLRDEYDETENILGHAQILQLLKFCLKMCFTFDGTIYEQVKDRPVGSPISGLIAEAVLQRLESLVLNISNRNSRFGQTGHMLGSRIHEHELAVRRGDVLSQVAAHTYEMGHEFNFAATKIVAHAGNKTGQELIEAWAPGEDSVNRFIDLASAHGALRSRLQSCAVGR
ncbi:hypothetical protein SprV_0401628800 [Sparganum proliferum]